MDELIKRVTEKTGISEDQARGAVQTVIGFLKERLPSPVAGQVDNVLGGGAGSSISDLTGNLGGVFGGK